MIGERFGRLVVISKTDQKQRREFLYECKCDCGNTTYQTRQALMSGHVRSCGCLHDEQIKDLHASLYVDGSKPSAFNDKPNKNNSTGLRGVTSYQQAGKTKYKASLYYKGKHYQKKGFATAEEARKYRLELEGKYL